MVLLLAGALGWEFRHQSRGETRQSTAGRRATQFAVADLDGRKIDSTDLRGKIVLVDFWATWCVPCESEIPHLVSWQQQYGPQGLQVIGLSMDDTSGAVRPYVAKHNMQYPVAMADDRTVAAFGGVLGLPVNVLIGRDGKMLAKHVGVTDIGVLQKEVEQALARH